MLVYKPGKELLYADTFPKPMCWKIKLMILCKKKRD